MKLKYGNFRYRLRVALHRFKNKHRYFFKKKICRVLGHSKTYPVLGWTRGVDCCSRCHAEVNVIYVSQVTTKAKNETV